MHAYFVAILHVLANPARDILRRRIHIKHFVDVFMVESVLYHAVDVREIGYHTVFIQFARFAIDYYYPVMTVQGLAFALVTEVEIMCSGNLQTLFYIIHCLYILISFVFGGVFYSRFAEGFLTLGAGAAFAAMSLAPLVATPCLRIVYPKGFAAAGNVGFGDTRVGRK